MADDAGALLVRSGLVSGTALDEARARMGDLGGTLGEQLVATGAVADDRLTEFYRQRLLVPQVNPNSLARLPAKVVAVIPGEMAVELRAIPVSLDADNNLTVAMSDPSDRHAVDEIAFFTGAYVVRAVATQMQIAWCLAHYYGHVTHLGQRLLRDDAEPAAQASAAPAPADPVSTQPRPKSITEQVKAARTRRIERGEVIVDREALEARPTQPQATVSDDNPTPVDTPVAAKAAPKTVRTPSSVIPASEQSDELQIIVAEPSGPVITIEAESAESGPVITIEGELPPRREDITARTKPAPRPVPKRRRPAKSNPPELASRAGEVQLATGESIRKIDFEEPSIMISDELERVLHAGSAVSGEMASRDQKDPPPADLDDNSTVVIKQIIDEASEPVILVDRKPQEVPERVADDASDVVVLENVKTPPQPKRISPHTQVGIGAVRAVTQPQTQQRWKQPLEPGPSETDETRFDAHAAPPAEDFTSTSEELLAAPPGPYLHRDTAPVATSQPRPLSQPPPPSGKIAFDKVKPRAITHAEEDEEDDGLGGKSKPTIVMSALELDEVVPGRSSDQPGLLDAPAHVEKRAAPADDEWGPPGSTIPPPLLGAIPGYLEREPSAVIPMPDVDTAPLMMATPVAPEGGRAPSVGDAGIARALEDATSSVLDLIHTLDHTSDRDQVIAVMIAHLTATHKRAGFFVTRGGELSLFAIMPRVGQIPIATLRLDRPSTLADVVGTRLPYRGPMQDEASRSFLAAVLGGCPAELLLVPIAVRERVVGVLFGDQRTRHTFDEQLALAARAAGMALERILKAKRT